jgi:predicted HAD superfamily Cof-like phosphohydrolase
MNRWQWLVADFHNRFGVRDAIGEKPELHDGELRARLILEEATETQEAIARGDLAAAVDGLADTIYVCLGAAVTWGVDLDPIFEAVHQTNMLKVGGTTRADGKVLKPEGWQPPDIEKLLEYQRRASWR